MVVRYVDRKASFVLVILVATVNLLVRPPSLELAVGFRCALLTTTENTR